MLFAPNASAGAPALICTSDSTGACSGRQYCCYEGMDNSAGDKYCKDLGCKRGGTSSCPTAANVSSCGTRDKSSSEPTDPEPVAKPQASTKIPWCIEPDLPAKS
ncbi:MAG: hypothetical protein A2289_06885 [Deltaproteobacteria bacterium RIFOXYA12_FULL_58_15]|nr:MAG: hypothetical protein A2289_06885 [Deltaproteobacteria bacterium RIFOXYA12_FULL_58_15]OGR14410.1 MAG: hypothetical protein A2341_04645 [Deltaproteobacteria bacterium RIFOXYB12_FULL_58_9]